MTRKLLTVPRWPENPVQFIYGQETFYKSYMTSRDLQVLYTHILFNQKAF